MRDVIKVFFSYAREDADLLDDLVDKHMGPLVRAGRIEPWIDRRELRAGHEWQARIEAAIAAADLIVLLLTSSFFGSDFIAGIELEQALYRWKRGEVEVVPVLVKRVTRYNLGNLEKLQIVPGPDKPIHRGGRTEAEIDDDWVGVTEEIERVIDELSGLGGIPDQVARALREHFRRLPDRDGLGRPRKPTDRQRDLLSPRGTTGYRWQFSGGSIFWCPGGAHAVRGPLAVAYDAVGGPGSDLGFPVSDDGVALDHEMRPAGRYQRFEGIEDRSNNTPPGVAYGASLYLKTGDALAHVTSGRIGQAFEELRGTTGPLGFPQGADREVVSGGGSPGRRQLFDHGALYGWDDGTVIPVVGTMHEAHERLGGVAGRFGFPIGAVTSDDVQEFEGGAIVVARPHARDAAPTSHPVVAAGSIRSGHQEQFVALPDGKVHRRWHYGGGWSNWALFETARPPVQLAVMSSREGVWGVCLAERNEPAIRQRWFQDGQWSAWEAVATPRPVRSVSAASFAPGHQEVFVALDDGTLYNRWKGDDGGWSSWTWFEAPAPVRRLAYGSAQPGSLELYALDVNGVLHARTFRQGGAWSDWTSISLNGECVAIAYGVRRDGHREMFAALADGRVVHQWRQPDGWSDWYDFGSVGPIVDLAVTHQSGRELEVFAITGSGRLVHRWYRPGLEDWSPWEDIPLP